MGGQLSKALGMSALPCHNKGRERADSTGKLFGNKEMRILMLGLDAAGKTSKSQSSLGFGRVFLSSTYW
jgi:hypothetical protein